jgi:hypothetical protein
MKIVLLLNNGVPKAKDSENESTPLLEHLEEDSKQHLIFMDDGALNPRIQVFHNDGIYHFFWNKWNWRRSILKTLAC